MRIPYNKPLVAKNDFRDDGNLWLQRLGTKGYVGSVYPYPGANSIGIRINHCQLSKSYLMYWLKAWKEKGVFRQIAHPYSRGEYGLLVPDVQQLMDKILPPEPLWDIECKFLNTPVAGIFGNKCECVKHPGWLDYATEKPEKFVGEIELDPSDKAVLHIPRTRLIGARTLCCPYHAMKIYRNGRDTWLESEDGHYGSEYRSWFETTLEPKMRRWKPNG